MHILQHSALKHPNSVFPTQALNHNGSLSGRGEEGPIWRGR